MTRLVPVFLVVAVAVGVIALAASGGSTQSPKAGQTGQSAGYGAPVPAAAPKAAVEERSTPLGKILVDAEGRSLYLFEADTANKSNCSGACLSAWPPLTSDGTPAAGTLPGKVGTIAAPGGTRQVTYDGHPLYLYAGDRKPGDTTGQGLDQFGAKWYALSSAGTKIAAGQATPS
jgi:predicted lipoprotein with Yx(FWY)xxD motif